MKLGASNYALIPKPGEEKAIKVDADTSAMVVDNAFLVPEATRSNLTPIQ